MHYRVIDLRSGNQFVIKKVKCDLFTLLHGRWSLHLLIYDSVGMLLRLRPQEVMFTPRCVFSIMFRELVCVHISLINGAI